METLLALLALCEGIPLIIVDSTNVDPVMQSFDEFFVVSEHVLEQITKVRVIFETPWCSCNVAVMNIQYDCLFSISFIKLYVNSLRRGDALLEIDKFSLKNIRLKSLTENGSHFASASMC